MQCLTRQDTEQVEYVIRVRLKRYANANSCGGAASTTLTDSVSKHPVVTPMSNT